MGAEKKFLHDDSQATLVLKTWIPTLAVLSGVETVPCSEKSSSSAFVFIENLQTRQGRSCFVSLWMKIWYADAVRLRSMVSSSKIWCVLTQKVEAFHFSGPVPFERSTSAAVDYFSYSSKLLGALAGLNTASFQLTFSSRAADTSYPEC